MTTEPRLAGRSILLVEDDYYLAMDAVAALENAGALVIGPIADQPHAATLVGCQPIDCAVLDINDGRGPSFAAAEALRDHKVPIVFVTGYGQAAIPAAFQDARWLQKPVRNGDLVDAISQVLTQASV